MKEDKATHVLVPIEWIENKIKYANDRIGWSKNSRIKACYMQEKLLLETLSKEFEPINPSTQQEYIKVLEGWLKEILEDYKDAQQSICSEFGDTDGWDNNFENNPNSNYFKAKQALNK